MNRSTPHPGPESPRKPSRWMRCRLLNGSTPEQEASPGSRKPSPDGVRALLNRSTPLLRRVARQALTGTGRAPRLARVERSGIRIPLDQAPRSPPRCRAPSVPRSRRACHQSKSRSGEGGWYGTTPPSVAQRVRPLPDARNRSISCASSFSRAAGASGRCRPVVFADVPRRCAEEVRPDLRSQLSILPGEEHGQAGQAAGTRTGVSGAGLSVRTGC